jgi:prephenate dehydrogenase
MDTPLGLSVDRPARIVVLGGTAGFGLWLAKFVIREARMHGYCTEVSITGRDRERGESAAQESGARYVSDNIEAVRDADVVVFSVSIAHTAAVIEAVAPYVRPDAVVLDVTSVKRVPTELMERLLPASVLVIPMHPMFGPYVERLDSQIVALTPSRPATLADPRYTWIRDTLRSLGATVIESSAEEHDSVMSVVQGMTHYSLFVFAEALRRLGADLGLAHRFSSPVYRMLIALVERYVSQNPELYADIQLANDLNRPMHEAFIGAAERFARLVRAGDRQGFIDTVCACKEFFAEDADHGQAYTDKIIALLARETRRLRERVGRDATIENIRTLERRTVRIAGVGERAFSVEADGVIEDLPLREWIIAEESL